MMVGKGIEDIDVVMPKDAYNMGKDMPTFNAYLTVIVRDSEGRVIRVHRQRSHSPTLNFLKVMLPISYFIGTGNKNSITNTGNTTCTFPCACVPTSSNSCAYVSYPNGANNYPTYIAMIQVGSGSQSNPASAITLAAPIANGSGSGQLLYGAVSASSNITVSGSSAYFTISQTYNNNSGGTITITEVGIVTYIQFTWWNANSSINCGNTLMWYDVLSSPISVPNGGSVTIYYTFMVNP
jgi:hypothetical protein